MIEYSYKSFWDHLSEKLSVIYDIHEASSLSKIIFEDVYHQYGLPSENNMLSTEITAGLNILQRLLDREPLQYILGQADFYGFKFNVDTSVLIPRQETEELVHWIIESTKSQEQVNIWDIGTGSGCIAISLSKKILNSKVFASDISPSALKTAISNAEQLKAAVSFFENDILQANEEIPNANVWVSNPPYINTEESLASEVVDHEPHLALYVNDGDPLQFYKRIGELALINLPENGLLFFETSSLHGYAVASLLKEIGFNEVELEKI